MAWHRRGDALVRQIGDDVRFGIIPDTRFNELGVVCLALLAALVTWGVAGSARTDRLVREGSVRAGSLGGGWWMAPAAAAAGITYAVTLVFPREVCVYTRRARLLG